MPDILFPTDYSPYSNKAFYVTINWLVDEGDVITFIKAYPRGKQEEAGALEDLKNYVAGLKGDYKGSFDLEQVKFKYIVEEGDPAEVIAKLTTTGDYEMVVMGSRGKGQTADELGSVTAEVIRTSTCPVLAVPEKAEYKPVKRIVYVVDYEEEDGEARPITSLEELAERFDAEIILLYVNPYEHYFEESRRENYMSMARKVSGYDNIKFEFVQNQNISSAIEDYVQNHEIDMLAMHIKDYHLIETAYQKSLTREMLFHTQVPLIAFHE